MDSPKLLRNESPFRSLRSTLQKKNTKKVLQDANCKEHPDVRLGDTAGGKGRSADKAIYCCSEGAFKYQVWLCGILFSYVYLFISFVLGRLGHPQLQNCSCDWIAVHLTLRARKHFPSGKILRMCIYGTPYSILGAPDDYMEYRKHTFLEFSQRENASCPQCDR